MPRATPATETARLVLLGASNLARCLPTALATTRAVAHHNHPELPAWIAVATGRGRSYGQGSRVLGRSLPGMLQSGLWTALEQAPAGPTYALLTDIGNDVGYGVHPDRILSWLETCILRLQEQGCLGCVTALPLDNLDRFPIAFLELFRRTLFPSSTTPIAEMLHRAERVDHDLRELCARRSVPIVEQPAEWFGLDPIHYRLRHRHEVWHQLLAPWRTPTTEGSAAAPAPSAHTRKLLYWRAWHERSSILGQKIGWSQPCLKLKDATPVSLF